MAFLIYVIGGYFQVDSELGNCELYLLKQIGGTMDLERLTVILYILIWKAIFVIRGYFQVPFLFVLL